MSEQHGASSLSTPIRVAGDGLPVNWSHGDSPTTFTVSGIGTREPVAATVSVYEPLAQNPDYLMSRFRTDVVGALGRPQVQSLPEPLADGISVVAFEEGADGILEVRIDLVRRAWDLDIVVSAATAEVEATAELFAALLDLLATVRPREEEL